MSEQVQLYLAALKGVITAKEGEFVWKIFSKKLKPELFEECQSEQEAIAIGEYEFKEFTAILEENIAKEEEVDEEKLENQESETDEQNVIPQENNDTDTTTTTDEDEDEDSEEERLTKEEQTERLMTTLANNTMKQEYKEIFEEIPTFNSNQDIDIYDWTELIREVKDREGLSSKVVLREAKKKVSNEVKVWIGSNLKKTITLSKFLEELEEEYDEREPEALRRRYETWEWRRGSIKTYYKELKKHFKLCRRRKIKNLTPVKLRLRRALGEGRMLELKKFRPEVEDMEDKELMKLAEVHFPIKRNERRPNQNQRFNRGRRNNRGRGFHRGGRRGRGRGRHHHDSQPRDDDWKKKIKCYNCQKKGHYANECPEAKNDESKEEIKEESDDDEAFAVCAGNSRRNRREFITIKDQMIEAVLDTGSSICAMSKNTAEKLNLELEQDKLTARVFGGGELKFTEIAKQVEVGNGENKVTCDFWISPRSDREDIIVGYEEVTKLDEPEEIKQENQNEFEETRCFYFPVKEEEESEDNQNQSEDEEEKMNHNQTEDEKENQTEDEKENQTEDEKENQTEDEKENQIEDENQKEETFNLYESSSEDEKERDEEDTQLYEELIRRRKIKNAKKRKKKKERKQAKKQNQNQTERSQHQQQQNRYWRRKKEEEGNEEEIMDEITIDELMKKYKKVFGVGFPRPAQTQPLEIEVKDQKPVKEKQRTIPFKARDEVERQIEEMLEGGIIRESRSEYASPCVLVRKRNGKLRICVDYRRLNQLIKDDAYPMQKTQEIIDRLGGFNLYSTIDLSSGYYQLPLEEASKHLTAFTINDQLYEFNVLPFGLKVAPAMFSRSMEEIFQDVKEEGIEIFMDDIIIASKSEEEHKRKLEVVLKRLGERGLSVNREKSIFMKTRIEYLGWTIEQNAISPTKRSRETIDQWPIPRSETELKGFLGLISYYRRIIKGMTEEATPLYHVLKKKNKFKMKRKQIKAFMKLKRMIKEDVQLPTKEGEFVLETDASGVGIGAVLMQDQEGTLKTIGFMSKTLNSAQKNYSTTEREMLAIIYSLEYFNYYLWGQQKITVYTDHKPITYLLKKKDPKGRIYRWLTTLQEYNLEIKYLRGEENIRADFFSRPMPEIYHLSNNEDQFKEYVRRMQERDNECQLLKNYMEKREKGTANKNENKRIKMIAKELEIKNGDLYKDQTRLYVPELARSELIMRTHITTGHAGENRMQYKIEEEYYFPKMKKEIKKVKEECELCVKEELRKNPKSVQNHSLTAHPMEIVSLDIVGRIKPDVDGNKYILNIIDHYSCWGESFAMKTITALETAEMMMEWITRFGAPQILLSDQGTNFMSHLIKQLCQLMKIDKRTSTAYHPQCNGRIENLNYTLTRILKKITQEENWSSRLRLSNMIYNSTPKSTTKLSPHYMLFGRKMNQTISKRMSKSIVEIDQYVRNVQRDHLKLSELIIKTNRRNQEKRIIETLVKYEVGERVFIYTPKVHKFGFNWRGPYTIEGRIGENTYLLSNSKGKRKKFNIENIRPYSLPEDEEVTEEDEEIPEEQKTEETHNQIERQTNRKNLRNLPKTSYRENRRYQARK